jgi:hypothetical protein
MNIYAILTNRKRAIIALIHSVFFLIVAAMGATSRPFSPIWLHLHDGVTAQLVMLIIYVVVSTILWVLTRYSRCLLERLYFGFCSLSASVGVLRCIFGDPPLHLAAIMRVLLLGCAVVIGFVILREHSAVTELAD